MLRERNPGSIVRLELDNDQKSFKYLFIALSATIKGWKYVRKVVAVDATFLTSEYKGALVVATAQDGEHHQYPLAWGVIDREKDASWRWFMNRLSEVIPDGPDVVVISDRHKSIMKAVRKVYKQADHEYREKEFEELYSDFKNMYEFSDHMNRLSEVIPDGPDVVVISDRHKSIMKAVREVYKQADHGFCAREKEFEELYSDFKNMYEFSDQWDQLDQCDFLNGIPKRRSTCKKKNLLRRSGRCVNFGQRYNLLTTNGAESINSVLKKAKRYLLLSLLDICVSKTVEWFSRYRVEACGADDSQKLTPYVYKVLHERFEKACTYEVIELNRLSGMFEARDEKGRRNLVNLGDRTCSCRKFDVDRYPCSHAIAATHKVGKGTKIHELCSEYYWRETWVKAYQETVYPVPDICDWVVPPEILNFSVMPPIIEEKRRTGRPKQNRFPGPGEARKRPHNSTSSFSQSDSSKRTNLKLFA
ncbi:PREDICTED: uncharacterized protein LOC104807849 [Tarenaya hassleriana]|uniref:uncharacterized protein LOC104807849 n=1 Tax=Tarenaya hassleriana TaxID=28532 RepID=UPI00053C2053|nr:PREDICTED: uncharacterized protein LOC104807849 [Tarenaya hassleriana]